MHCNTIVTTGKMEVRPSDIFALNEFARQQGRQQLPAPTEQPVELTQHPPFFGIRDVRCSRSSLFMY